MIQLILFILTVFAVVAARRYLKKTPLSRLSGTQQSWLALGAGIVVLLALTGRLGLLVPLLGTVLAALFATVTRIGPALLAWAGRYRHEVPPASWKDTSDGCSAVETVYLRMQLRHDSGDLSGTVLEGPYQGHTLHALTLKQLAELYRYYGRYDQASARLLGAYLERVHGDRWQEPDTHSQPAARGTDKAEALHILGLDAGASRADIIAAHRRLIQKLHPDRGGSDYLAAKINQAKDLLLNG